MARRKTKRFAGYMGARRRKGKGSAWRRFENCNSGWMPSVWTRPIETSDPIGTCQGGRILHPLVKIFIPLAPQPLSMSEWGSPGANLKSETVSRSENSARVDGFGSGQCRLP